MFLVVTGSEGQGAKGRVRVVAGSLPHPECDRGRPVVVVWARQTHSSRHVARQIEVGETAQPQNIDSKKK